MSLCDIVAQAVYRCSSVVGRDVADTSEHRAGERNAQYHGGKGRCSLSSLWGYLVHAARGGAEGMLSSERQIENLLGRYADYIDTGQLEKAAELFRRARVKMAGTGEDAIVDWEGVLEVWRAWMIIYPDSTPRTKHVITNAIIEIDEQAGFATSATYYTVLQQTDGFPLQPICAGRYHDEFRRVDDEWHFSFRDYSLLDLVGDLSHHGSERVRQQLGL
jgi:hypothetical protein